MAEGLHREQIARPADTITVQRWQLDRLADGLAQIVKTADEVPATDRMRLVSAIGYASGSAQALAMLVESMRKEKP